MLGLFARLVVDSCRNRPAPRRRRLGDRKTTPLGPAERHVGGRLDRDTHMLGRPFEQRMQRQIETKDRRCFLGEPQTTCVRLPSRSCGNSTVVVPLDVTPGVSCACWLGRVKCALAGTSMRVPSGSIT